MLLAWIPNSRIEKYYQPDHHAAPAETRVSREAKYQPSPHSAVGERVLLRSWPIAPPCGRPCSPQASRRWDESSRWEYRVAGPAAAAYLALRPQSGWCRLRIGRQDSELCA